MTESVFWKLGCFVFIVVIVGVLIFGYMVASTAIWAENSLHAILLSHDLVREYMVENDGEWPRSWEDLEKLPYREERRGMFQRWPERSKEVQKYVVIDFAADISKLNTESTEEFSGIQPIGPCFNYDHYPNAWELYKVIEKYQRKKRLMSGGHFAEGG